MNKPNSHLECSNLKLLKRKFVMIEFSAIDLLDKQKLTFPNSKLPDIFLEACCKSNNAVIPCLFWMVIYVVESVLYLDTNKTLCGVPSNTFFSCTNKRKKGIHLVVECVPITKQNCLVTLSFNILVFYFNVRYFCSSKLFKFTA